MVSSLSTGTRGSLICWSRHNSVAFSFTRLTYFEWQRPRTKEEKKLHKQDMTEERERERVKEKRE